MDAVGWLGMYCCHGVRGVFSFLVLVTLLYAPLVYDICSCHLLIDPDVFSFSSSYSSSRYLHLHLQIFEPSSGFIYGHFLQRMADGGRGRICG